MKFNDMFVESKFEKKITLNGKEKVVTGYFPDSIQLIYPYQSMNAFVINGYEKGLFFGCDYASDDIGEVNAMLTCVSTAMLVLENGGSVNLGVDETNNRLVSININTK